MNVGGQVGGGSMRWLLTYADMITLLLAFFVIMYAVSKVDAKKYKTFATSVQTAFGNRPITPVRDPIPGPIVPRTDPLAQIQDELRQSLDSADLRDGRIQMERTAEGLVLRFQDTVFFERGRADLSPEARGILDKVAAAIAESPYSIEAEGHTDTLPIRSARFPSNWELSLARATAVMRYFVQVHGMSPLRLSSRGLGEFRPLYPDIPGVGERRNRRVELKITRSA